MSFVDGGDGSGWCRICNEGQDGYPCLHDADDVGILDVLCDRQCDKIGGRLRQALTKAAQGAHPEARNVS